MKSKKQIYVITGGPGFGKTMLIEELRKSGYLCSGEFARDLIESELSSGGEILPWKNPKLFQQEILKQRIDFYESVPENTIAFADRGIPDQLAFARYKGFGFTESLLQEAQKYEYSHQVFITPPWPEIFRNDAIRTETYEEAVRIHEFIRITYAELNYQIFELPLKSIRIRMEYLFETILKCNKNGH